METQPTGLSTFFHFSFFRGSGEPKPNKARNPKSLNPELLKPCARLTLLLHPRILSCRFRHPVQHPRLEEATTGRRFKVTRFYELLGFRIRLCRMTYTLSVTLRLQVKSTFQTRNGTLTHTLAGHWFGISVEALRVCGRGIWSWGHCTQQGCGVAVTGWLDLHKFQPDEILHKFQPEAILSKQAVGLNMGPYFRRLKLGPLQTEPRMLIECEYCMLRRKPYGVPRAQPSV